MVLTCWPRGWSGLLGAGTEGAGGRASRESAPRAAPAGACAPRSARRAWSLGECGRGQPSLCVPAPRCVRVAQGTALLQSRLQSQPGIGARRPLSAFAHPVPLGPLCPAGEAPPLLRSQGPGPREATDHRLPGGPRRRGVGCKPMSARGRG